MQWNEDNILKLAPNAGTIRRGQSMSSSSKWATLGTNYEAIWGECLGSGASPYQVQANLKTVQFKCSCPVRALPCKHILGLLLLYAKSSGNFKYAPPPSWLKVSENNLTAATVKTTTLSLIKTDDELEKARLAKEKRWQQRLTLMGNGIGELELWLEDIIRQGLANVGAEKASFWSNMAAKMVDAKMPSLSSFLKETHQLILHNSNWIEPVIARLGELHLWVEAFQNKEKLPQHLQEELFVALGKTTQKAIIVQNNPKVVDTWFVLAVVEEIDIEGRNYRKVWLQGLQSEKYALILDYSFGNIGYDEQYFTGTHIRGKLVFYSNNYNQRAVFVKYELTENKAHLPLHFYANFEAVLVDYNLALTKNPWIFSFPALVESIVPHYDKKNNTLLLIDQNQNSINTQAIEEEAIWKILAISGGNKIAIFGEWNGFHFIPLSLIDDKYELILLG